MSSTGLGNNRMVLTAVLAASITSSIGVVVERIEVGCVSRGRDGLIERLSLATVSASDNGFTVFFHAARLPSRYASAAAMLPTVML